MPTLTVTAEERAWFARCHRAWDLGARGRQDLQPRAVPPPGGVAPALLRALAVHYFPGMWTWDRAIVDPCWLVEHRVVDAFATADELALDEAGLTACWAWAESELAAPPAGTQYTELRLDPPGVRRTVVPRSPVAIADAGARLGRAVAAMVDPGVDVDPTPAWSHCRVCPFRIPCVAMQRGEDARRLLATGYERRPPDELEEGRLGGTSWGLGRGARPPRW